MKKEIVFIDMDGVSVDFMAGIKRENPEWNPPEMFEPGFFRKLPIMPGAKEGIETLAEMNTLELYILTKPTTRNLYSTIEKYQWIEEHFPFLLRKIILACDKTLLKGDYLIDDDMIWKGFDGTFLYFNRDYPKESWKRIISYFDKIRRRDMNK